MHREGHCGNVTSIWWAQRKEARTGQQQARRQLIEQVVCWEPFGFGRRRGEIELRRRGVAGLQRRTEKETRG